MNADTSPTNGVFTIRTDIRTVPLHMSHLWRWEVVVTVTKVFPTRVFEITGFGTTLDAAQAEMVWAKKLVEMKLAAIGLKPVE